MLSTVNDIMAAVMKAFHHTTYVSSYTFIFFTFDRDLINLKKNKKIHAFSQLFLYKFNIGVFQRELPGLYDVLWERFTQLEDDVRFYGYPIDKAFEAARQPHRAATSGTQSFSGASGRCVSSIIMKKLIIFLFKSWIIPNLELVLLAI